MYVHVQQNKRTESTDDEPPGDSGGASVLRTAASRPVKCVFKDENVNPGPHPAPLIGSTCCKRAANAANINPADYIALPVAKDEPCHVCGRRQTSAVLRDGGKYLCYDCLSKAKRPAKVRPLPGVLDHRGFERVKVELGRCDICKTGKAVYVGRGRRGRRSGRCDGSANRRMSTEGAKVLRPVGPGVECGEGVR